MQNFYCSRVESGFFTLYRGSFPPEISIRKSIYLFYGSENQMTTEISLETHPWLQLVPQAALPFCGPEFLIRLLFHFRTTSPEPWDSDAC